ncbi:unnamed protein product [Bursaphelenchus xylophilus]|uniref:(pine wood nematode) hypothetical protein n=1 Tax=Bursaphelenchus xylophilus TaxID=6326 RepID=A0A1I7S4E4_BURXY|nr:unnamed protein product [Bursaphelenchus xylophilus]CAG9117006.1 unnamed protein product [Bursaphelenchus xylophilus]
MRSTTLGVTLAMLMPLVWSWAVIDGPSSQYEYPEARYMPAYEEALYRQKLQQALMLLEDAEPTTKRSSGEVPQGKPKAGHGRTNKFFRRLFYAMRTGI